ncbi:amidophosphoribosyltransferase [Colwellia sp. 4_MG-2023]|jgi:amidophosphoribosyltransferase|uniref:amidophosphoribosyltransferase n=1 Tax=unclassified Colwellia TaxID=196834 RepID=UPI001C09197A|nr:MULTISPECIES: amidophosphoribosyltransferase [unclassified Colwellia]MBU2924594.1 amidophosphoribosyltransferase [Colwellia sp. C2M11]MDO6489002.1 amidophosphoribosyltransferase [Colwellia sp. 6_MG-2023]MDO6508693.1 amidophosphoribosyltransferase [Colwellia sp. 5_MG-2023]MDO6557335.1 amidophosphoribosyltransferase [Colwellia sp. 4_MG-2023]MDO6654113.1 amidophosphoribosyltransferase [Colwellia sp. 3_MG-2023]
MCGIVGIVGKTPVNQYLYDGLTVLQHRGQDAAGIVTIHDDTFRLRKGNGLVKDVFHTRHMLRLQGNIGIGHVRYPTAGTSSSSEAQPFYANSPYGISLAHNGNLTNADELKTWLNTKARRHVNTTSDSELLLNILGHELQQSESASLTPDDIFTAITNVHKRVRGAYATVALIIGYGMVAFRDPNGIRPLVFGKRETEHGIEYMIASETVALDACSFEFVRDVAPGEAIFFSENGQIHSQQCFDKPNYSPCIFEFVYFARPDSTIDKISVYASRVEMGTKLGEKIAKEWDDVEIDVVIPIPETSCDIALQIAKQLNLPYRQGFVKNRYIGRTFIMPGQEQRKKSVRQKLNAIGAEFKGKNVLLVDDSVVRGTTSEQIIEMARASGANKVYFASAAPEVRFPNVYGIDMPSANELIAHGRDVDDVCELIGADKLIYQSIEDLVIAVRAGNPEIKSFDTSVFDGIYVTNDIDNAYLEKLDAQRNNSSKEASDKNADTVIDMYNEGAE